MRLPSSKIVVLGVFATIGLLLGYLESVFILPVKIPMLRIGFSNIVTVVILYLFGPASAFLVLFVRILLSGILFGSGVSFLYSFAGGILSFLCMWAFYKRDKLSPAGVSIIGAVAHNIGQILAAAFLMKNIIVLTYIPALIIIGSVSGLLIGLLSIVIIKRMGHVREEFV